MNLFRSYKPVMQFFENDGTPLVGGKLKTYLAGTNTPVATYADPIGTLNPVSIPLNSRGECVAFLDGEKQYKFVLEDKNGSVIWTADNITAAGGGSGGGGGESDLTFTSSDGTVNIVRVGNNVDFSISDLVNSPKKGVFSFTTMQSPVAENYVPFNLKEEEGHGENTINVTSDKTGISVKNGSVYHVTARLEFDNTSFYGADSRQYYGEYFNLFVKGNELKEYKTFTDLSEDRNFVEISFDYEADSNKAMFGIHFSWYYGDVVFSEIFVHEISNTIGGGGQFTQEQSDWNEEDDTSPAFIKNKPVTDYNSELETSIIDNAEHNIEQSDKCVIVEGRKKGLKTIGIFGRINSGLEGVGTLGLDKDTKYALHFAVEGTDSYWPSGKRIKVDFYDVYWMYGASHVHTDYISEDTVELLDPTEWEGLSNEYTHYLYRLPYDDVPGHASIVSYEFAEVDAFPDDRNYGVTDVFISETGINAGSVQDIALIHDLKQIQWVDILNKPHLSNVAITGNYNDLRNKPEGLTIDTTMDPSSNNAIANSAVYAFVNSSIGTNTAYFLGTSDASEFSEFYAWLQTRNPTNNDYVFWETVDNEGHPIYKRYKYNSNDSQWHYEYELNNSSFTAVQWSTINSGLNSSDKTKLNGIEAGAQVNVRADWNASVALPSGILNKPTVPTASTSNPLMDGTASYGSGTSYARSNHRHPTDTSRQAALPTSGTAADTYAINISGNAATATNAAGANFKVLGNGTEAQLEVRYDYNTPSVIMDAVSSARGIWASAAVGAQYGKWALRIDNSSDEVELYGNSDTATKLKSGSVFCSTQHSKWYKIATFKQTNANTNSSVGATISVIQSDLAFKSEGGKTEFGIYNFIERRSGFDTQWSYYNKRNEYIAIGELTGISFGIVPSIVSGMLNVDVYVKCNDANYNNFTFTVLNSYGLGNDTQEKTVDVTLYNPVSTDGVTTVSGLLTASSRALYPSEIVSALPASPEDGVMYLIPET